MNPNRILERIRRLDIPSKAKAELTILASRARLLVLAVLRFIHRHRRFGEALALGVVVAYLLSKIPVIGGFLSLCAMATAAAIGLMRELRESLEQLFADDSVVCLA